MKKVKIILIMVLLMILIGMSTVNAAVAKVTIEGDSKAKVAETKKVTVKVETTGTEIGIISGKIKTEGNITIKAVTAKNSWSLTYNDQEGEAKGTFNMVKAAGTKSEEIMEIEYTAGNTAGKGKIILESINAANINYESEELGNIVKEITIEDEQVNPPAPTQKKLASIEITKAPTKTEYTEGEKFDKSGMIVKAKYSDGSSKEITNYTYAPTEELEVTDTKIVISYTEDGITKTVEQPISVIEKEEEPSEDPEQGEGPDDPVDPDEGEDPWDQEEKEPEEDKKDEKDDGTVSDKEIPDTGIAQIIIPIAGIALIAVISYIGYKKYRNI